MNRSPKKSAACSTSSCGFPGKEIRGFSSSNEWYLQACRGSGVFKPPSMWLLRAVGIKTSRFRALRVRWLTPPILTQSGTSLQQSPRSFAVFATCSRMTTLLVQSWCLVKREACTLVGLLSSTVPNTRTTSRGPSRGFYRNDEIPLPAPSHPHGGRGIARILRSRSSITLGCASDTTLQKEGSVDAPL